ncbi:hypothetical protein CNMCM7927_006246 [Aspergillus lentulus]|nr:hypothetical protein CNMCM7927_006246 [Aspergillus lentulus]
MLSNKLAIASLSLGQHPSHHLDHKIQAAAEAGYKGIEIVYFELEGFSQAQNISILEGAEKIRVLCQKLNLDILSLAPFENYEGDRSPLSDRLQKARHWVMIARVLHASYLQIPSNYKPDAIGDKDVVISELQQLADIGSAEQPVVSIAYEYLSWGTHCSTWEVALQYVNEVNRPNFGLCLDTFHEATKLWGDPFAASGRFPDSDKSLRESLNRFVSNCPVEKIFFLQLSDGERFDPPFSKGHPWFVEGEAPQFTWSKHARPFPLEHDHGAYLPITDIAEAWILEELCRNHLQEHKRYRKWQSEVLCSLTPSNIRRCRTNEAFSKGAPRLLLEIAQSPRLAPYVEELSSEPFDCPQGLCLTWDSSLQCIRRLVQASRIVEDEEVWDWMHAVATGTGGAALALALGQLTELKSMELEVNAYDIIFPYVPRAPLSSLTDVRVNFLSYDHDEEEGDDEWNGSESSEDRREQQLQAVLGEDHFQQIIRLLTALARLPALKNLSLWDYYSQPVWQEDMSAQSSITYDWDDAMDPAYPLPPANSGLESVVVDRGNISSRALSRIIDGCSSLKQFKYMVFHTPEVFGKRLGDGLYRNPLPEMSIEAVCITLLTHTKFSLRHLHIELMEYGSICGCRHEPCLKPYRPYMSINPIAPSTTNWRWNEFTRLERLTLDIDLFSNLEGSGWLPFAQTLPASIQHVVILAPRCPPGADTQDFQNMFRDFNPQSFPKLRSISAWHRNYKDSHELGHNGAEHILVVYRLALEQAGIRAEGSTEYALGSDYFAKRKKPYCHWSRGIKMNQFGMDDYNLYALPETDLKGRVVFGVYHTDSSGDVYTGITIEKA